MRTKLLVVFHSIAEDTWRAECFTEETPLEDRGNILSPVIGSIEETLDGLRQVIQAEYRFNLTCIKCGNSESREYGVSEETGVCEFCNLSAEEKRRLVEAERRQEEYVYGPPDVDYPPDTLPPEY